MIIRNIIRKEFSHLQWVIVTGILFSVGTAVLLVFTHHYMQQFIDELPAELIDMLMKSEMTHELLAWFGDYSVYVWSQWHAKNWLQLAALFSIIIASIQFAGEVSNKTIGFFLSRPISRFQGYAGKVISALLILLFILVSGSAAIWLFSAILGYTTEWIRLFSALVISLIWIIPFYILGTIISMFNKEAILGGVIIGLTGAVLSIPGLFAYTRQFSIFYHMRATDYFLYNQSPWPSVLAGLILSIALLYVGSVVFGKKDF